MTKHVVVDGRVLGTEAADRGMGRYVGYLASLLVTAGHVVTLLVPRAARSVAVPRAATRRLPEKDDPLAQTAALDHLLVTIDADVYLDATPFLAPLRYDICICPVIAVLYDLIPMRFLNDYFAPGDEGSLDGYVNGLARVRKADRVIAISNVVRDQALRYLAIPRERVDVIPPHVGAEYLQGPSVDVQQPGRGVTSRPGIVSIQGAHRSKNFPVAIRFLEDLSTATGVDVDVIVPTPTQRSLIDNVRRPDAGHVRVCDSISEASKLALQRNARVVAHLSLEEGYGIPLAEALLLNRPIICIDNAINRELLAGADPAPAGVLLLDDPSLASDSSLAAAARFVASADRLDFLSERAKLANAIIATQAEAGKVLAHTLARAADSFCDWHSRAGLAIVAPTEFGSCGVSDYCHALLRDGSPRYAVLLGRAPRPLLQLPQVRLLPIASIGEARRRAPGFLFNLAVSESLLRAFDEIALRSRPGDVLVVHDAGSYLPGLLLDAAGRGDWRSIFERYLCDESSDVRALSEAWLRNPPAQWADSEAVFLTIDRRFRSAWLRQFKGALVSHHAAFAEPAKDKADSILGLLPPDSVILSRTRYVPMPIDRRCSPGIARLAEAFRRTLGLAREDLLVCCAGSIVRGKHLDVIGHAVARLDVDRAGAGLPGAVTLLLAGRVLEEAVYRSVREAFETRGHAARVVQLVETDEVRYDAMLLASDAVVAFREQRRIQMSHSYVRSLALGRPMITNSGAGFDDADAALVCRDEALEDDLYRHLENLLQSPELRVRLGTQSMSCYREHHTVATFFQHIGKLNVDLAAV